MEDEDKEESASDLTSPYFVITLRLGHYHDSNRSHTALMQMLSTRLLAAVLCIMLSFLAMEMSLNIYYANYM